MDEPFFIAGEIHRLHCFVDIACLGTELRIESFFPDIFIQHILSFIYCVRFIFSFQPVPYLISGIGRLGDFQPVHAWTAGIGRGHDFYDIAILQRIVDGNHLAVDTGTDTFTTDG